MTAEDNLEQVKDWAEGNFRAMKNRMEKLQDEMRNNSPRQNINVRKVDAENLEGQDTDQIVVEYSVERWYSVNYFKQMLKESSGNSSKKAGNVEMDL